MTTAHTSQFALLKTRRFLPLFVTQALSAFIDNAFRFAVASILITSLPKEQAGILNTLSAALFILPFFLFSATAGQLADKFDKAFLARRIKFIEIGIVVLSAYALFSGSIWLKQLCIFLAGSQAAFFGPIKYSILPQHLKKEELLGGNGMVEMATFLAVLAGTIFGNLIITHEQGKWAITVIMIVVAVFSYWTARQIPDAPAPLPDLKVSPNIFASTWTGMKLARERPMVFQAILGISWFWLLGVVFVTQMQLFTNDSLRGTPAVASIIFALFSIGIAAGSVFCNKLLGGKISVKYVPAAALLMSVFMIDLYFAGGSAESAIATAIAEGAVNVETSAAGASLIGIGSALGFWQVWRVLFDLAATAFCSGLFVVPLFAVMQSRTPFYQRARVVGANNIYNALFMVGATLASVLLLGSGLSARGLILCLGLANLAAAIYIIRILPHELLASLARGLFKLLYRVEVKGMENVTAAGRKALVVANHTSLLDGPLLSAFLPERAAFAINTQMSKKWWVKPAFALYDLCPIDPSNAMALRALVDTLRKGRRVVIFPEGRLTTTGGLMKIYEGPGAVAEMANAPILPVRIDGAQFSPFSRLQGVFPRKLFPKITLTFLPPVKSDAPEHLKGSALREFQAENLYDVMTDMVFRSSLIDQTLWQGLLDARKTYGGKKIIFEDIQRQPMSYNKLLLGSFVLGRKIAALTPNQKHVGVLLPNANAAVATVFGLHAFGRVPAMLNFSTGAVNMSAACTAAHVRTIITSHKFIEAGEMQEDIKLLEKDCRIVYLEDVRESVGTRDKLRGVLSKTFARAALKNSGAATDANDAAVILFTSGSEGVPKGVVLSHRNLIANCQQINARIAFTPQDIFFTALPVFHAFGFTGGIVLTSFNGMRSFLYPSPLHYKIIPELVYDTDATVLIATDTFLNGYGRNAHAYDFQSLRLVVGGAERVKPETRSIWMERFGLRIIEGYGATECAPAVSANTPMHSRTGSVGRIFDGMDYRVEPVEGIAEGGRLFIKGPNVMKGYLRADNPGVLEAPVDGWYDTGDIVSVDDRRYVTILGRAKRFSKIAGEMVSLTAIEAKLHELYPDTAHAVVAAPDAKKGEQLVMFTTIEKPDRKQIATGLKALGCSELMLPKIIASLEVLPVLGTGKTDYVSLGRMALEKNIRMKFATVTERLVDLAAEKWAVHIEGKHRKQKGEDLIFLSIGEPDLPPPEAVLQTARQQIRQGRLSYSPGEGEHNLLESLSRYHTTQIGRSISTKQFLFLPGTQTALYVAFQAILDHGDEVLLLDPYYATYEAVIAAPGGIPVAVPLDPDRGFHPDIAAIARAITPRTRAILLNSPSNPTGAVFNAEEIHAISTLAKQHDLWIVSDEVYASQVHGNHAFASPFFDKAMEERTIVVSSISKSHAVPGFRCGWIMASEEFCARALPVSETMLFGCQPFLEDALAFALDGTFPETLAMKDAYYRRSKLLVEGLKSCSRVKARLPEGGMFVMLDVRATGLSGEAFARLLLAEQAVVTMPGESFGQSAKGHVRIAMTVDDIQITEAARRICALVAGISR